MRHRMQPQNRTGRRVAVMSAVLLATGLGTAAPALAGSSPSKGAENTSYTFDPDVIDADTGVDVDNVLNDVVDVLNNGNIG